MEFRRDVEAKETGGHLFSLSDATASQLTLIRHHSESQHDNSEQDSLHMAV